MHPSLAAERRSLRHMTAVSRHAALFVALTLFAVAASGMGPVAASGAVGGGHDLVAAESRGDPVGGSSFVHRAGGERLCGAGVFPIRYGSSIREHVGATDPPSDQGAGVFRTSPDPVQLRDPGVGARPGAGL
jgi:hypothetical protein